LLEELARPEGETSNSLFDILTEWNVYLERHPLSDRELATSQKFKLTSAVPP